MSAPFGELITAMVTPFTADGKLNTEQAGLLAERLVENGSDALVVSGTTGETPTLSEEEKVLLFRTVTLAVRGKARVLAGTGSNDTAKSVRLTRMAEECGADGIMLVVPYYNKPPQEGMFRHFAEIAGSTSLPVMLYNVPGRTGVNMTAETTLRLAGLPNVKAIKEASGDLEQITRIRAGAPEGFYIYSGDDALTLPILAVGGTGVVSVASHVAGREIKQMVSSFKNGDHAQALCIHLRLTPLFRAMFIASNPIPVKTALNMLGIDAGPLRPPLTELGEADRESLRKVLAALGYLK